MATTRLCEQLQVTAYHDEATAYVANTITIAAPELGNRLEVWRKPAGQPHQFDIALALPLQTTARLHAIEIAVDIDLEQHCRVVRRSTSDCRRGAFKSQRNQLEFFNECVDDPDGIVFCNKVIETLRQQRCLIAVRTFDKSPHLRLSRQQVDLV
ncbi:hypothetical protein QF002_007330 [Paraburkholderia youngii]